MPRVPIDYSKSVIYKIQHKEEIHLLYIGSTSNFRTRKNTHKCECSNPNQKNYNLKKNIMIRDFGGWEMFNIIQIKEFPCNNKRELEKEEDNILIETHAIMNTNRAFVSDEEKKKNSIEFSKKYYEKNKDKIKKYNKEYSKNNKDKINENSRNRRKQNPEKFKEVYEKNKDKINENARNRRKQNPEKFKELDKNNRLKNLEKIKEVRSIQYTCICGGCYKSNHKSTHLKTKKHLDFLLNAK